MVALPAALVLVAADPFERLAIPPVTGRGLTPILEHPAMLIHPPVLYAGLLAAVVPFLLALDTPTPRTLPGRRAIRGSAVLLGAGLVLGANWAYVELGWGGYWAWDPVENAALLPWIALLIALHGDRARWHSPRALTALAMAPFAVMVVGAWVSRAGLTGSVHAFAQTPGVGRGFASMAATVTVATVWVALGRPGRGTYRRRSPVGIGAAIGIGFLLVVAVGTAYPVIRDIGWDDKLTVEGRYFSRSAWPVAIVALGAQALLVRRRTTALLGGAAVGALLAVAVAAPWAGVVLASLAGGAAAVAFTAVIRDRRRRAIHLAHLGIAVLLLGVAGTTATVEEQVGLFPGRETTAAGHTVVLDALEVRELDGDRRSVDAVLTVDGVRMVPSLVAHERVNVVLAETALDQRWSRDVQVVLRDATDGFAVVDVRDRPLASLIWIGAVIMLVGLGLTLRPASVARVRSPSSPAPAPAAAPSPGPAPNPAPGPAGSAATAAGSTSPGPGPRAG